MSERCSAECAANRWSELAVPGASVVLPEVGLHKVDGQSERDEARYDGYGTACRTESLALERMTDGDIALARESKH